MQHFQPVPKTTKPSFERSILLLPLVSLGNVPQLAADLIIASLEMRCIGVFDARDHVPMIGSRDDDCKDLPFFTPLERAPLLSVPIRADAFAKCTKL
jgi:proteasome assembly chaperone 2